MKRKRQIPNDPAKRTASDWHYIRYLNWRRKGGRKRRKTEKPPAPHRCPCCGRIVAHG